MTVPHAERAVVEIAKLRDYSLNPAHQEGKHKARVFAAALGLRREDAAWLREVLLKSVRQTECQLGRSTSFGQRYIVDFVLSRADKTARLRSVWNLKPGQNEPRLVTCHAL